MFLTFINPRPLAMCNSPTQSKEFIIIIIVIIIILTRINLLIDPIPK
jgi:hypothetical protein